jgi:hypothetical protein
VSGFWFFFIRRRRHGLHLLAQKREQLIGFGEGVMLMGASIFQRGTPGSGIVAAP